ncbi:hypothetical protein EV361DRAFT_952442 [Lentinula raphanica]|nr:hypothetical protein FB446DRAFT_790510 [Lentinula raphanica]KAJ3819964.1 hypothetical protein F5880DRAFT_1615990 [Lentinula raphanica]KAJ3968328.1 hypothetical protein EV361DRAFT_952442 [Lentinula raphanica]
MKTRSNIPPVRTRPFLSRSAKAATILRSKQKPARSISRAERSHTRSRSKKTKISLRRAVFPSVRAIRTPAWRKKRFPFRPPDTFVLLDLVQTNCVRCFQLAFQPQVWVTLFLTTRLVTDSCVEVLSVDIPTVQTAFQPFDIDH